MATLNERAAKSVFSINENTGFLIVENAVTRYRNFEGRPSKKFKTVKKTFDIVLNEEVAQELLELGWNVKTYGKVNEQGVFEAELDENGLPTYKLTVNVGFDLRPPMIMVCSEYGGQKNSRQLDENDCGLLDSKVRMKSCDVVIKPSKEMAAYLREFIAYEYVDQIFFADKIKDYTMTSAQPEEADEVPFE